MSLLIDLDKNDGIIMLKNSQTDSFNPWQPNMLTKTRPIGKEIFN